MRVASWLESRSLVWPWNSGSRMNTESMRGGRAKHVLGRQLRGPLIAGELAIGAQALGERRAQAGLMRAAVGVGTVLQ